MELPSGCYGKLLKLKAEVDESVLVEVASPFLFLSTLINQVNGSKPYSVLTKYPLEPNRRTAEDLSLADRTKAD